jgi:hypothetical protein
MMAMTTSSSIKVKPLAQEALPTREVVDSFIFFALVIRALNASIAVWSETATVRFAAHSPRNRAAPDEDKPYSIEPQMDAEQKGRRYEVRGMNGNYHLQPPASYLLPLTLPASPICVHLRLSAVICSASLR